MVRRKTRNSKHCLDTNRNSCSRSKSSNNSNAARISIFDDIVRQSRELANRKQQNIKKGTINICKSLKINNKSKKYNKKDLSIENDNISQLKSRNSHFNIKMNKSITSISSNPNVLNRKFTSNKVISKLVKNSKSKKSIDHKIKKKSIHRFKTSIQNIRPSKLAISSKQNNNSSRKKLTIIRKPKTQVRKNKRKCHSNSNILYSSVDIRNNNQTNIKIKPQTQMILRSQNIIEDNIINENKVKNPSPRIRKCTYNKKVFSKHNIDEIETSANIQNKSDNRKDQPMEYEFKINTQLTNKGKIKLNSVFCDNSPFHAPNVSKSNENIIRNITNKMFSKTRCNRAENKYRSKSAVHCDTVKGIPNNIRKTYNISCKKSDSEVELSTSDISNGEKQKCTQTTRSLVGNELQLNGTKKLLIRKTDDFAPEHHTRRSSINGDCCISRFEISANNKSRKGSRTFQAASQKNENIDIASKNRITERINHADLHSHYSEQLSNDVECRPKCGESSVFSLSSIADQECGLFDCTADGRDKGAIDSWQYTESMSGAMRGLRRYANQIDNHAPSNSSPGANPDDDESLFSEVSFEEKLCSAVHDQTLLSDARDSRLTSDQAHDLQTQPNSFNARISRNLNNRTHYYQDGRVELLRDPATRLVGSAGVDESDLSKEIARRWDEFTEVEVRGYLRRAYLDRQRMNGELENGYIRALRESNKKRPQNKGIYEK